MFNYKRYMIALAVVFGLLTNNTWAVGSTTRVNLNSFGQEANGSSANGSMFITDASISATGRWIAFESSAFNLVDGDTNGVSDIFVRDNWTGNTRRVSVSSTQEQANGESLEPAISGNGRFVAFQSSAFNLVPNDNNGSVDIFVHDLATNTTERISVNSAGVEQEATPYLSNALISADDRFVAFQSGANNLVDNDTNITIDIFLRDRQLGTTTSFSVSSDGQQGNIIVLTRQFPPMVGSLAFSPERRIWQAMIPATALMSLFMIVFLNRLNWSASTLLAFKPMLRAAPLPRSPLMVASSSFHLLPPIWWRMTTTASTMSFFMINGQSDTPQSMVWRTGSP